MAITTPGMPGLGILGRVGRFGQRAAGVAVTTPIGHYAHFGLWMVVLMTLDATLALSDDADDSRYVNAFDAADVPPMREFHFRCDY